MNTTEARNRPHGSIDDLAIFMCDFVAAYSVLGRSKDLAVDGQSRNVDRKRRMARPRFPGLGYSLL